MEQTDIELMLRVRRGDLEAYRLLIGRYRAPLRRFCAAMLADRSETDDCVQEIFLRLWLLRERYEPTGRFSTYLFQIARNYLLNQRKRYRPTPITAVGDGSLEFLPASEESPETLLICQERDQRIRQAVEQLPEHYRLVFTLHHDEGLKYAEIAQRLGIPIGTVKSRMAEATRLLRQALNEHE